MHTVKCGVSTFSYHRAWIKLNVEREAWNKLGAGLGLGSGPLGLWYLLMRLWIGTDIAT